jgi:hypothetical protein
MDLCPAIRITPQTTHPPPVIAVPPGEERQHRLKKKEMILRLIRRTGQEGYVDTNMEKLYAERLARYTTAMRNGKPDKEIGRAHV